MLDKALRYNTHPAHERTYNVITGAVPCHNPKSWLNRAKGIWDTAKLEIPVVEPVFSQPPWQSNNIIFITELPAGEKADHPDHVLCALAMERVEAYSEPACIRIYTDGSVDHESGKSGCRIYLRYLETTIKMSVRIQDNASFLQTELIALQIAISEANRL